MLRVREDSGGGISYVEIVPDHTLRADDAPRFPSGGAFVVQFATGADIEADRYVGRVEHVVSGRGERFATRDELLRFMARILRDGPEADAQSGD